MKTSSCSPETLLKAVQAWRGRARISEMSGYLRSGNHEYYGHDIDELRGTLKESGRAHEVWVLDGDEAILNGVRILGATLWTDFAVCGESPESVAYAIKQCSAGMTDYHVIRRWRGPL